MPNEAKFPILPFGLLLAVVAGLATLAGAFILVGSATSDRAEVVKTDDPSALEISDEPVSVVGAEPILGPQADRCGAVPGIPLDTEAVKATVKSYLDANQEKIGIARASGGPVVMGCFYPSDFGEGMAQINVLLMAPPPEEPIPVQTSPECAQLLDESGQSQDFSSVPGYCKPEPPLHTSQVVSIPVRLEDVR